MEAEYHSSAADKPLDYTQIPKELRRVPQWMGTRFERRKDGKLDKPPYRVRRSERIIKADKTDPENWATFDEALAAYERGDVGAIGFVFTEEDPFFVVDLDDILDIGTGEIHRAAAEVIHALGSYAELSCSGRGVHVIGSGAKPEEARCKSHRLGFGVEVYDRSRFVVLTGNRMGSHTAPQERQHELEAVCQRLWPKPEFSRRREKPPNTGPVDLEDAVLLERARTARSGPKFHKLYDLGDTSGYASPSDADYALINALIFWTAGDRDRIIGLFEASALYRAKEKHRNYVALSVDNGLASYSGAFYRPRPVEKVRREERREDPLAPYLELLLAPSEWKGRKAASAHKTYVGLVWLASEHGIFDDAGNLRIGCDMRRLAEAACTRRATIQQSGLPELFKMGLVHSRRPRGAKTSTFILPNPRGRESRTNRVSTHFIGTGYAPPKNTLETLRLLARMRSGKDEHATMDRLGMPAMFVAVALASSATPARGKTLAELAECTGRRPRDLKAVLKKLKAASVVREPQGGVYGLTVRFRDAYERHLELSGITYTEREQRRRHAVDRKARDARLRPKTGKRPTRLRGKEQMNRLLKKQREREGRPATAPKATGPMPEDQQERIDRFIREGMSPRWARMEVLAKGHPLDCGCGVCV